MCPTFTCRQNAKMGMQQTSYVNGSVIKMSLLLVFVTEHAP